MPRPPPKTPPENGSWEYASWTGPRRAMLERARRLTLRERLNEMLALIELNERFSEMRAERNLRNTDR